MPTVLRPAPMGHRDGNEPGLPMPSQHERSVKPPGLVDLRRLHSAYLKERRVWALGSSREELARHLVELGCLDEMPKWPARRMPSPKKHRKAPIDNPAEIDLAQLDFDGAGRRSGGVAPELGNTKRQTRRKATIAPDGNDPQPVSRSRSAPAAKPKNAAIPVGTTVSAKPPPPSREEAYQAFLAQYGAAEQSDGSESHSDQDEAGAEPSGR